MTWTLLDFQWVIPVPCSAISHFYCKRKSASNNFAVLDRADKLVNVIFGMRQELKGELLLQKFVSHVTSTISPMIVIFLFFYSGACPERTKNWVPRPVIQLQKSNTQIPCCRTHIQNKVMLLLTENIKKVSQTSPSNARAQLISAIRMPKENRETSWKNRNADDIRDIKCLQTDAGSNFLIGGEGEKIQCNDIFVI
jgi:hypothetical protein